jgi:hypothetical protein
MSSVYRVEKSMDSAIVPIRLPWGGPLSSGPIYRETPTLAQPPLKVRQGGFCLAWETGVLGFQRVENGGGAGLRINHHCYPV